MSRVLALAAATAAITAVALPGLAAELTVPSRIDAVTVFPQGAEVQRVAKTRIEAGGHTLVITDLPGRTVPGSIRVDGKATAPLLIGGVDTRQVSVPRSDAEQAATERRRIEQEIERTRDERTVVEAAIQAAELQKKLMENLAQLPVHPAPAGPGGAAGQPDWSSIFNLIGTRMADAQKVVIGGQVTIRELDRKLKDLERKLAETAPRVESRTEVKIAVSAAAPVEAELLVRYMVPNAGWTPTYDARLVAGPKGSQPKVTLTRRATIAQRSGEAWENVAVTLSTTRPAGGTAAPELKPWTIDFVENVPRPAPPVGAVPAAPAQQAARARDAAPATEESTRSVGAPKVAPEPVTATTQSATLETGAFQATFAIKDRVSVPETGEEKRVVADEVTLDPVLTLRTTPRLDPKAYIYAKLTLPRTAPYLAGPISLFRDQTFVGQGRLPQLAPGEEHELGFGPDDQVRVRYSVVDEKRGETGLISTSKTDNRLFRVAIRNGSDRPVSVTVLDHVPVANNQDIKVELTGRAPSRRDLDDRRGVMAWDDQLKPDEEKSLEYGYRITWPAAKQITHMR